MSSFSTFLMLSAPYTHPTLGEPILFLLGDYILSSPISNTPYRIISGIRLRGRHTVTETLRRRREYSMRADGRPPTKAFGFTAEVDTRLLSPRIPAEDDDGNTLASSDRVSVPLVPPNQGH